MEDFSNQDTHIYDDEIIIRVLNDAGVVIFYDCPYRSGLLRFF